MNQDDNEQDDDDIVFASLSLRIPDAVRESARRGNPESDATLNDILSKIKKFHETSRDTLEGEIDTKRQVRNTNETGQAAIANSPGESARVLAGPQFEAGEEPLVVGSDFEFTEDCVMMHEQVTELLSLQR